VDFAADRKISVNKMIGIGAVILLHILLIYALVTGLATSVVDIIKKPLQVVIIAPAPPPPPPPVTPPPPPKLVTPPVPYIPPPLIQVQQPPPPPVFAVTTTVKPPPAPVRAAPPQPAAPSTNVNVVCPNVNCRMISARSRIAKGSTRRMSRSGSRWILLAPSPVLISYRRMLRRWMGWRCAAPEV
jgi:outer membrane biosynthesis protein TonB